MIKIVSDYLKQINHSLAGVNIASADLQFVESASAEISETRYGIRFDSGESISIASSKLFDFIENKCGVKS